MSLSRSQKCWIIVTAICVLLAILFIWQPVSFAWLSSSLRNSTFSVDSSDVSTMTAEMWTYAYVSYDNSQGDTVAKQWYPESLTKSADSTAYLAQKIGDFGTDTVDGATVNTFSPSTPVSLHFGQINNLVQEDENLPIYMKFTIELKRRTNNKVILSYKNDSTSIGGNYLSIYKIDFDSIDSTTKEYIGEEISDDDLLEALNDIEEYPFLRFHYFVSDNNYSIGSGVDNLTGVTVNGDSTNTVDFAALFETGSSETVKEYMLNEDNEPIVCNNKEYEESTKYIYVKINVRSDTLAKALNDTTINTYIPAYLLFAVIFGVEIRTTAYTGTDT